METKVACLTPPGAAAIATIAVRGPLAWPITHQLFRPMFTVLPQDPPVGRHWFGTLGVEYRDEVVLAVNDFSHIEVHCHGGIEVVRLVGELYVERGALLVSWQQFQDDQLLVLLAQAPTTRTANILLDQAQGAWRMMLERGNPPIERLASLIALGQHLVAPWRVVIAGAPNVGKSCLMNALAGFTRSIVSPIPGTTRDVVTMRAAIDGWPIELSDTAGIRDADSQLERKGIERAEEAARIADLCLWVLDGSTAPAYPKEGDDWLYLINKIDLPSAWDWQNVPHALRVSAQTGSGLKDLCDVIPRQLVPDPPVPGDAVPCLPEQVAWVHGMASNKRQAGFEM